VGSLVKTHHKTVGLHFELSPGFHELAIELFGLRFIKAVPRRGQPSVVPLRKHGQGHIPIPVEPHLTGQTVEVKEMDADAKAILNPIASGVAGDEVSGTGVEVVGYKESRLGMPQAVHGHLPYGARVPTECRRLVHIADVLVAAFGDIEHRSTPSRGWEGVEATSEGGAPAPKRHKPDASLIDP
jgi:hypothetical protein